MTDEEFAELEAQATILNRRWDIEAWSRRGAPDYRELVKELLLAIKTLRDDIDYADQLMGTV